MCWPRPTPTAPWTRLVRTSADCSTGPLLTCRPGENPAPPAPCSNGRSPTAAGYSGRTTPSTLTSTNNLARNLHALGEYERARQLDDDTLTRLSQVIGADHPDTLHSASNLALDLRALGEYERARQMEEHVRSHRRS